MKKRWMKAFSDMKCSSYRSWDETTPKRFARGPDGGHLFREQEFFEQQLRPFVLDAQGLRHAAQSAHTTGAK